MRSRGALLFGILLLVSHSGFAQAGQPGQTAQPGQTSQPGPTSPATPQRMPARPLRPGETPPKGTAVIKGQVTAGGTGAPVRRAQVRAQDLVLMAFHPLGTARADARPDHGVVDGELCLHDMENVWVADASMIPSSIGVNPQITIMALATRLAYALLGKAAPDDEPEPESIARPRITQPHALTA